MGETTTRWIPATDDYLAKLEPRWDGAEYTANEFITDRSSTVGSLATQFREVANQAQYASGAIGSMTTPQWTGQAATMYNDYRTRVNTYLVDLGDAMHAAALACTRQVPEMDGAFTDAGNAAKDCNVARKRRKAAVAALDKTLQKAKDHWFLNPADAYDAYQAKERVDAVEQDMTRALGRADAARQRNRDALDGLVSGWDAPDNTLANLILPALPDASAIADPNERALFQSMIAPIAAALAGTGNTARAQDAKAAWDQAMKEDPTGRKAKELLAKWAKELTGPELDWVLNHLDETELATTLRTLDPFTDRELYNAIAAKAGLDTLNRLADTDPNHYWHPVTGGAYQWDDTGAVPGQVPTDDLGALKQQGLGDCYWLASLGAIEKRNPGFLNRHVRANANGTYTVTLYKDGKPIEVTVTPEVPFSIDNDGNATGPAYAGGSVNVYQLYEKAMAQVQGELQPEPGTGYKGIGDGGWPDNYMPILTGEDAESVPSADVQPDDLQKAVDAGKPVVVGTNGDDDAKAGKGVYDPDREPHLIPGHAYYVDSVNTDADPPTVTVVNPWGRDSKTDGTVTLTWDEYQRFTNGTYLGK